MDAILQFLIDWGYWGLFLGSFIAGSVLPFSSEAVLAACVGPLGLDPVISIAAATAGNVSGGMTCYWMGHLGNMEWIEKYFHVKKEKMDRAEKFVHGRGAWMAFFAFIPILGSAISIVLGMMRANIWIVILAMTIGKVLVGLGSAGSLRFNEVILWNWNRQQTAVIHSMYLSWMSIIIR